MSCGPRVFGGSGGRLFAEATGLSLPRWRGVPLSFRPRPADERRGNVAAMVRHKVGHCRGIASTLVGEGADETVISPTQSPPNAVSLNGDLKLCVMRYDLGKLWSGVYKRRSLVLWRASWYNTRHDASAYH